MGKPQHWLGLDIGGANLKAAMTTGYARHASFALWKNPTGLPAAIGSLISDAPPHAGLAVTMTGELADCFQAKAEGVAAIVSAVESVSDGRPVGFFSTSDRFLNGVDAIERWPEVAAANWYALALECETRFLIDVGSTTTDVIGPGFEQRPTDDTSRLLAGELLYQGVGRTPVCAVVDALPYRDRMCPVAAEFFATTADVAILLDHQPPSDSRNTADGRPATRANAAARMGRMLCADRKQFTKQDALVAARYVCDRLEQRLCNSIEQVIEHQPPPHTFTLAGEGAWLARAALLRLGHLDGVRLLKDHIGANLSRCAPAWAVASRMEFYQSP